MSQDPTVLSQNGAAAIVSPTVTPAEALLPEAANGRAPLHIALLGYRSNPFSGGQGVYLRHLSAALVGLGHSVDVISGEPYPHLDPRVRLVKLPGLNLYEHRNHVLALRSSHFRSWADLSEYLSMLTGGFGEPYAFGRRLVRHLARTRPAYDVIHDNQSLARGLLKLGALGYPVITTIHHPITHDRDIALASAATRIERFGVRRWYRFLRMQGHVARRLHTIVTVSERSKRDIHQAFGVPLERLHVVPNGIDLAAFVPVPGIAREPLTLITTTSADQPLKGARHLLRALRLLMDEESRVRLIMIGQLKRGGSNESLVRELGLDGAIEFHHGLGAAEISALYARAAIAVVPSEYEGFGLPAGEAMACGVPVVATDGGALPEVVGDAGLIVPAKDPVALADAIRRLLRDPALQRKLALAGRARIEARFNWREAALSMTRLYQAAVHRGA
jgi:glycosyltransferase involved in cell wall biosynthesis